MNPFNAIASVLDALKVWPEPPSLPETLEGAEPLALAEARSRLQQIAQVATELRRLIDHKLAAKLDGKNLRYGEDIIRPGAARPKIINQEEWWGIVLDGLMESGRPLDLLAALYPADAVRLTALPKLAATLGMEPETLREKHVAYQAPTSPLSVMPRSKAPKFLQDMEEGEVR